MLATSNNMLQKRVQFEQEEIKHIDLTNKISVRLHQKNKIHDSFLELVDQGKS